MSSVPPWNPGGPVLLASTPTTRPPTPDGVPDYSWSTCRSTCLVRTGEQVVLVYAVPDGLDPKGMFAVYEADTWSVLQATSALPVLSGLKGKGGVEVSHIRPVVYLVEGRADNQPDVVFGAWIETNRAEYHVVVATLDLATGTWEGASVYRADGYVDQVIPYAYEGPLSLPPEVREPADARSVDVQPSAPRQAAETKADTRSTGLGPASGVKVATVLGLVLVFPEKGSANDPDTDYDVKAIAAWCSTASTWDWAAYSVSGPVMLSDTQGDSSIGSRDPCVHGHGDNVWVVWYEEHSGDARNALLKWTRASQGARDWSAWPAPRVAVDGATGEALVPANDPSIRVAADGSSFLLTLGSFLDAAQNDGARGPKRVWIRRGTDLSTLDSELVPPGSDLYLQDPIDGSFPNQGRFATLAVSGDRVYVAWRWEPAGEDLQPANLLGAALRGAGPAGSPGLPMGPLGGAICYYLPHSLVGSCSSPDGMQTLDPCLQWFLPGSEDETTSQDYAVQSYPPSCPASSGWLRVWLSGTRLDVVWLWQNDTTGQDEIWGWSADLAYLRPMPTGIFFAGFGS